MLKIPAFYNMWNPEICQKVRPQSYPTWPHYDQALALQRLVIIFEKHGLRYLNILNNTKREQKNGFEFQFVINLLFAKQKNEITVW